VIVVGPELKLSEVGIPKKMALELFKPFVIKRLLDKELAFNVRGASRLIEQETDEVWASLEEVVKDKYLLLNRAPTLHRLGIQAFKAILIEGEAIKIHPLVCKAFNADFDGDQMAVHLPLSQEAQQEAREIMLSSANLLKPATGLPIVGPSQDIILGCYWLTKILPGVKGEGKLFGSSEEAQLTYEFGEIDLRASVKVWLKSELVETSIGRLIFNEALPDDFPFQNQNFNSKKLEELVRQILEKYGPEKTPEILDRIKTLGFDYATRSGTTWGMDDLKVPLEKPRLIEQAEKEIAKLESHFQKGFLSAEEKYQRSIEIWQATKAEVEKLVPRSLPEGGSVFDIIDSGSRGSWSQPVQMAGMKGLVINPIGRIIELPIKHSYKEGFDVLEYFLSTHGARKGTADTALRTSTAGYLTRRLVDVSHDVIISEKDCGDKIGTLFFKNDSIEINQNFALKIVGRLALADVVAEKNDSRPERRLLKKGEYVDWEKAKEINLAEIPSLRLRSPLSCKLAKGVCQKCYGWSLGSGREVPLGEAVGVVAAQAIGEPGTQLTMRTFHTGGVAASDITMGLPRVEEIFEAREPMGKAALAPVEGEVLEIVSLGVGERMIKIKSKTKAKEFLEVPLPLGKQVLVSQGDQVLAGQPLTEGNLDLKELFKAVGLEPTQRHIITEVQRIYVSQGAGIHDKHLELIVRQMFSRLKIKESGESQFLPGEVISQARLAEENERLEKAGKAVATATPILLGISKVALTTDSFLSAASFQETSRVLISSAVSGRQDQLQGLKENVIIGKLIPSGTGFKK
jgi:DNA-directed RNA polymerase subunit beta'